MKISGVTSTWVRLSPEEFAQKLGLADLGKIEFAEVQRAGPIRTVALEFHRLLPEGERK